MPIQLAAALPETQAAFEQLKAFASDYGCAIGVTGDGGVRTLADTALIMGYRSAEYKIAVAHDPKTALVPIGQWRPIAPFGHSFHNYGAAFDIRLSDHNGLGYDRVLALLGDYAEKNLGLRWGGNFRPSQSSGPDPVHFELAISLNEARARWDANGAHSPVGFASVSALGIITIIGFVIFLLRRF